MIDPRIIWQAPDGSIAITTPALPAREGEKETAWLDRVAARTWQGAPSLAGHAFVAVVEASAVPSRRFRNAWRWDGSALVLDLEAAKLLLAAEVGLRSKAPAAKVSRILAAISAAKTVKDLEAAAVAEGWTTALGVAHASGHPGEDM